MQNPRPAPQRPAHQRPAHPGLRPASTAPRPAPAGPKPAPAGQGLYRSRKRRRAQRRKAITGAAVLAVLVVVLFVTALLLGGGESAFSKGPLSPSAKPAPQAPSASAPVAPPRTPTPYDEDGIPALFNRFNKIPDGWEMDLVNVGGGQRMDARAAAAFTDMVAAAAEDDVALVPLSGYRTHETQYNLYHNKLNYWLSQGLSEEEALLRTERYHAIPGTSEHEAGLAMDIGDAGVPGANIEDSFADTEAFEWLQQHCAEFGFIYRYQKQDEGITHIAWEPWHYRYVGANHAERIAALGVTLEGYVELLIKEAEGAGAPLPSSVPVFEGAAGGA